MSSPITSINGSRVNAADLPIEQLANNQNVTEADKAKEAARQFEAVLLRQILESTHKTGVKGLFNEESASKDVYLDMMNFHLADTISRGGGLGLASALEAQLQSPSVTSALEAEEPEI